MSTVETVNNSVAIAENEPSENSFLGGVFDTISAGLGVWGAVESQQARNDALRYQYYSSGAAVGVQDDNSQGNQSSPGFFSKVKPEYWIMGGVAILGGLILLKVR